jgi:hypothetical protein
MEHANDHLRFLVHDMRHPFYINYFNFAFNFFTSFGYFATAHDHVLASRAFANAIKPGGTLVIDYLNLEYTRSRLVAAETTQRGDYTFDIERIFEQSHFLKIIRFRDENSKRRQYVERVAGFSFTAFKSLFEKAGLKLAATFGDYDLGAYNEETSPRMILVLSK